MLLNLKYAIVRTIMPTGIYERLSTEERFFSKILEVVTGCWVWQAGKTPDGYGTFRYNGNDGYAHRYSYELHMGPIPKGLQIDHLCLNTSCVNPLHLDLVTNQENAQRGRQTERKSYCPQGHAYIGDNIQWERVKGGTYIRRCRICISMHNQAYLEKHPTYNHDYYTRRQHAKQNNSCPSKV